MKGCNERVTDWENLDSNMSIAMTYGSELAGDFGTVPCGKPIVWDGKCDEHKKERRKNTEDRRKK